LGFTFLAFVEGPYLGMHESPRGAYNPILPVMPNDDGYAFHFLVVSFYKADVLLEGSNVFPAVKIRSIDQQPYAWQTRAKIRLPLCVDPADNWSASDRPAPSRKVGLD
jgi:hypothetical protein